MGARRDARRRTHPADRARGAPPAVAAGMARRPAGPAGDGATRRRPAAATTNAVSHISTLKCNCRTTRPTPASSASTASDSPLQQRLTLRDAGWSRGNRVIAMAALQALVRRLIELSNFSRAGEYYGDLLCYIGDCRFRQEAPEGRARRLAGTIHLTAGSCAQWQRGCSRGGLAAGLGSACGAGSE